jgi:hypothetical protein
MGVKTILDFFTAKNQKAADGIPQGRFSMTKTLGAGYQVSEMRGARADTSYETPPGRNSEQIERRTLNVQRPIWLLRFGIL